MPIIRVLLCSIFTVVGIYLIIREHSKKKNCTLITKGVVCRIDEVVRNNDNHTSTLYCPIFQYTVLGQTYEGISPYYSSFCSFSLGQTIDIYYNPNNPKEFYTNDNNHLIKMGYLFVIVGIISSILTYFYNPN